MDNVIVKENKYSGRYVAVKSFSDNSVVASGKEVKNVIEKAHKGGTENPVLIYVPKKNETYIL